MFWLNLKFWSEAVKDGNVPVVWYPGLWLVDSTGVVSGTAVGSLSVARKKKKIKFFDK